MSKTTIIYKDIPPGADELAVFSSKSGTQFSSPTLLRHENDPQNIAALSAWTLDGSLRTFKNDTVPFWSDALSDENGVFGKPPVIVMNYPKQYSSVGMTFVFGETAGSFAAEINIKWYRDSELVAQGDFYPDENTYACIQKAQLWNRVVITFRKTWMPRERIQLRQIILGVIRKFGMDEIRSAKITNQISLISTEVPVCSLNWTLDSLEDVDFMFQFKQTIEVWNDDFLIGVFYLTDSTQTSRTVYNIKCDDAFGVMDGSDFPGGVYGGYSAKQLFLDVVDGAFNVDFFGVADYQLTGVLQSMTRRAALQQILFAWGVCAATDGQGGIRVFALPDAPADIGLDRAYTGASVKTDALVTEVIVTAHTYAQDDNGSIEINGKKYSDTETVYTVKNPDVAGNEKSRVIKIEGANFVNTSNGQKIAQRVYDYYMRRNTETAKIVWRGELLGDCVTLPTAWGASNTGNISRMSITLSNTVAADCEVVA